MQHRSTDRRAVDTWSPTSATATDDTVVAVHRRLDKLIKEWRRRGAEHTDTARKVTGRQSIQEEAYGRVIGALADECRLVLVECGLEAGKPATKRINQGSKRR